MHCEETHCKCGIVGTVSANPGVGKLCVTNEGVRTRLLQQQKLFQTPQDQFRSYEVWMAMCVKANWEPVEGCVCTRNKVDSCSAEQESGPEQEQVQNHVNLSLTHSGTSTTHVIDRYIKTSPDCKTCRDGKT